MAFIGANVVNALVMCLVTWSQKFKSRTNACSKIFSKKIGGVCEAQDPAEVTEVRVAVNVGVIFMPIHLLRK